MVHHLAYRLTALSVTLMIGAALVLRLVGAAESAVVLDAALMIGLFGGGLFVMGDPTRHPSRLNPLSHVNGERELHSPFAPLAWAKGGGGMRGSIPLRFDFVRRIKAIRKLSLIAIVWLVGMTGTLIGIVDANFRTMIAFPVTTLALLYWLINRFSHVRPIWTTLSLQVTVGLIAVAGGCLYFAGESAWGALAIPLCMFMIASHSYKAFSERNDNRTLAAHWAALTVLLWIGVGLLGGISAYPELHRFVPGTLIETVITDWLRAATLAIILGMGNQVTADMRGENRRITGLSAYWLVAFGVIIGGLIRLCAGVVQATLIGLLGYEPLLVHDVYLPALLLLAALFDLAVLLGLLIYAVQFWARRPRY